MSDCSGVRVRVEELLIRVIIWLLKELISDNLVRMGVTTELSHRHPGKSCWI